MIECIKLAKERQSSFSAALVDERGEILEIATNTVKKDGPVAHAETNVLQHAFKYRDKDIHLITSCEPCPMCASAAVWAGVKSIYYGASIEDAKDYTHQIDISCEEVVSKSDWRKIYIEGGVKKEECIELLKRKKRIRN